MKKQTFPNQPEEMPTREPAPEIQQPDDPRIPTIPREDPLREPQELPPDTPYPDREPEIRPTGS